MVNVFPPFFQDEYTGTVLSPNAKLDFGSATFLGFVGDKMQFYVTGDVSWGVLNKAMSFDGPSATITMKDCTPDSFLGEGFIVGDSFAIVGSAANDGNYTIQSLTDT